MFVDVQEATAASAPEVATLVRGVFRPFAESFAPTALRWSADKVAAQPADWLVADVAGRIVGVVHHHNDPEGYTLDALSVRPEHRFQGIGSRLLAEVERRARERGAVQMIVALRRSLTGNVAFFESHGYRVQRRHSADHDVYTKPLGGPR